MTTFIRMVQGLAYGEAVADFDAALAQVIEAANEHQKHGELTVTIKVVPQGDNQFTIENTYKTKVPQKDRHGTIMYLQGDGSLGRRDPRQPELPLYTVTPEDEGEEGKAQSG